MGLTENLAEFAVKMSFEDLPPEVLQDTKRLILDGMGCALGGFAMKDCGTMIAGVARILGGPAESTILGDWSKVSCLGAAYANAKLGNLMDMDDVFLNMGHQSPMVLYPALAMAEREGSSGKEFLAAVALGFDVSSRVVLGVGTLFDVIGEHVEEAEVTGFGQGIFGGAVAAGRLLKLDQTRMVNAMGMAGLHTPAPLAIKAVVDMSMSKYQLEWAAAGALLASLLAQQGFAGPRTLLDDELYAKSLGKKTYLQDIVEAGLGSKWHVGDTSLKPYPTCRQNHIALDLVKKIVEGNGLQPDQISRIVIRGLGVYQKPPWNNYQPQSEFEAQFSVPFEVALIAHRIQPGPAWMEAGLLGKESLRSLAQKVVLETEPEIAAIVRRRLPLPPLEIPTAVTIVAGGKEYTAHSRNARGDGFRRELRLTDEEVKEKFRTNAGGALLPPKKEEMIQKVWQLEKIKNMRELFL